MVEVVSPHDLADDIAERVDEYFAAGTTLMWVVYPTRKLVYIYESPRQLRILGEADELDGGGVLPGFRIPIASLFHDSPNTFVAPRQAVSGNPASEKFWRPSCNQGGRFE